MKRYIRTAINIRPDDLDQNDLWELAKDPETTPEMLDRILETTDSSTAFSYALRNPNLSTETLLDYIRHPYNYSYPDDLFYAFLNPNMPMEILTDLSGNNYYLYKYLVYNDKTPVEVLEKLAQTYPDDKDIISGIARNPKTPVELLRQFVNDKDGGVRTFLACNESLPYDLQQILANDPTVCVRGYLARNPNLSDDLLAQLAEDDSNHVRDEARMALRHRGNT